MNSTYDEADCTLSVTTIGNPVDTYKITIEGGMLKYRKIAVEVPASPEITFHLSGLEAWSPDFPSLYTFKVEIYHDGEYYHERSMQIGFREFTCDRHRFLLNGKPIFLKGVCLHDHFDYNAPMRNVDDIQKDLQMIKDAGCNFVRLVHYPHNERTLSVASHLGLLVSEEPGLWWSDTSDPEVSAGSLEVLSRTIKRDRNSPAVAFWLCFNECKFTERFLLDSVRVCRELDPTRLVSGANCMSLEDTLKYYRLCGFDFYTYHPYASDFSLAHQAAETLTDKPLMFTEWGGYFVYNDSKLINDFQRQMLDLWDRNSDEGALTGASFWCFSDIYDYNRGEPACIDGTLVEGLVRKDRTATASYFAFRDGWKSPRNKKEPAFTMYYPNGLPGKMLTASSWVNVPLDAITANPPLAPRQFERMRKRKITVGPILPRFYDHLPREPFLLDNGAFVDWIANERFSKITLNGIGVFYGGWPISGEIGDHVGDLTVTFADGSSEVFELQNGIHLASIHRNLGSSHINPLATLAEPILEFGYDLNFEDYRYFRVVFPLKNTAVAVKTVRLTSRTKGCAIAVLSAFGE